MFVGSRRSFSPEESVETNCELCGRSLHREGAMVLTDTGGDSSLACPSCVAYFGGRYPEHFPTIAEFESAKRHYPEPISGSDEEATHTEEAGSFGAAYDGS